MNHAQLLEINSIHSLALAKFLPGDRLISTELSEDLESFNITIDELLAMSLSDVQDECDFLKEIPNSNELLDIYNHASLLKINILSQNHWKETPMPTAIATPAQPTLTAAQLAANDERFPEIVENYLMGVKFDITQIDQVVLAITMHESEQTEATRLELVGTCFRAHLPNIWTEIKVFKSTSEPYQDLLTEVIEDATRAGIEIKPEVEVSLGGLAPVATPTKSKKAKAPKAPKQAKVAKTKPTLPLPAIADLAALEAMSRKDLMEATKGVNSNFVTGVRANAASVELKRVLAKHILNTEYIEPTKPAKAPKASKSKAIAAIAPMPEGLTLDAIKAMKYRELQKLAGILRDNGKFEGNIGGKGATTDALRSGICKGLGLGATVRLESSTKKPMQNDAFINKYCKNLVPVAA